MMPTYIVRSLFMRKAWNRQIPKLDPPAWTPRVLDSDIEVAGEVTKVLKPGVKWRIKYMATFWSARSQVVLNLSPGDEVKVTGRRGGALLIEPVDKN